MKVPTDATKVFSPTAATQALNNNTSPSAGFPVDMQMIKTRSATDSWLDVDRLRGSAWLSSNSTSAETALSGYIAFDSETSVRYTNNLSSASTPYIFYNLKRAPSFFDEVCYTGDASEGTPRNINHNLQVVPELIITKKRSQAASWFTYHAALTATNYVSLNSSGASTAYSSMWNDTSPTSTVFTTAYQNASGDTYVAYLFATCAGVSKVGSYTGTGTTLQVNCGFTGGARFVLIKRTDSTGDWYVWDSARGIVAGNDPYLLLNSTAAEVTNTDYVDTYSAGFEISSTAPSAINASGGTFIFFAVA